MRLKITLAILCVVLCLVCACLPRTARRPVSYYTLEYNAQKIQDLTPLPCVVRMQRFSVAPEYNLLPIVYRDKAFIRNTYAYHKWRANPGDLATYFLARDIKNQGMVTAVLSYESNLKATHSIEGSVEEFYERDSESGWEAVLGLTITLVKEQEPDASKRILFQKQYKQVQKAGQKNPKAIAQAMSTAMARVSARIIKDLHEALLTP